MTIKKYTLRRPAFTSWGELEDTGNLLSSFLGDAGRTPRANWVPPVDVAEHKDGLVLTAEVPGFDEEQISVDVENNVLTISGEKAESKETEHEETRYHLVERRAESFKRSFTLPRVVKLDEISAELDGGILTLKLPKAAEAQGRKIQISKN